MIESFNSIKELLHRCKCEYGSIAEIMLWLEAQNRSWSTEEVYAAMEERLVVMENSATRGIKGVRSYSGLTGKDAFKLNHYARSGKSFCGPLLLAAMTNAVAINEVNAAMGIICASPTAGSSGIVPATLLACRDYLGLSRQDQHNFLLTAAAFGLVIGNNASLSGAEGGCQAEVGSASAMAAAALVTASGGSPEMAADACAIAIMNLMGLVCDPVAGLVEIPCIKRNAIGVANAFSAADMALAGVHSEIPCDEVISAMGLTGQLLPQSLRETAEAGLAQTETALKMASDLKLKKKSYISQN